MHERNRRFAAGRFRLSTLLLILWSTAPARAAINASQVLVVYNSAAPQATELKNHYLAAHSDIPAANVLDLNNPALYVADLTRSQFDSLVRDPIRNYLLAAGPPEPEDIIAIALIRPFPHRIQDTSNPTVGDNPNGSADEFSHGDNNGASVDADLVLLWQDLTTGEAGGNLDSLSDNIIVNPMHLVQADVSTFSRASIRTTKSFAKILSTGWNSNGTGPTKLTAGDVLLVSRIDGNSLAAAQADVDRAQNLIVNRARVRILLDEFDQSIMNGFDDDRPLGTGGNPWGNTGPDYENTRDVMTAAGWDVRYDGTFNFVSADEEPSTLIAYASYGENHSQGGAGENPPGNGTYIEGFHFAPGAIFNTIESYNARALNGLGTLFNQEQVADFIDSGGTFAIGHVHEPFTFAASDNEYLLRNFFLNGRTWAEAAYSGIPMLSWQHVVFGDPLATAIVVYDPGLPRGDLNGDGLVNGDDIIEFERLVAAGPLDYHVRFPTLDPIARGDFTGDFHVTAADAPGLVNALLNP